MGPGGRPRAGDQRCFHGVLKRRFPPPGPGRPGPGASPDLRPGGTTHPFRVPFIRIRPPHSMVGRPRGRGRCGRRRGTEWDPSSWPWPSWPGRAGASSDSTSASITRWRKGTTPPTGTPRTVMATPTGRARHTGMARITPMPGEILHRASPVPAVVTRTQPDTTPARRPAPAWGPACRRLRRGSPPWASRDPSPPSPRWSPRRGTGRGGSVPGTPPTSFLPPRLLPSPPGPSQEPERTPVAACPRQGLAPRVPSVCPNTPLLERRSGWPTVR